MKKQIGSGSKDVSPLHNEINSMIFMDDWCNLDSKASEKLSSLISNNLLCKDITRLSPLYQTSSLEAFHSVVIHFAPKYQWRI